MSLGQLPLLFGVLIVCVANEVTHHFNNYEKSSFITASLLQNLAYLRNVTEMYCTLRIYDNQHGEMSLNLQLVSGNSFHSNYEPYELFETATVHIHSPQNKFRSSCWSTVFVIETEKDESIIQQKLLGNPFYDHFNFIAESESTLNKLLTKSGVLNKVCWKYGMYVEESGEGVFKLLYLLEPPIYMGSFQRSDIFYFTRKLNNVKGRILNIPVIHLPPIFVVERDGNGTVSGLRGSHYNFVTEFAKGANFTTNFYGADKKFEFGKRLENGTWTGFIGELTSGIGDLATVVGQLPARFPLFEYAMWSYREIMPFCVKDPDPLLHWHALVFPLSKTVWTYTLTSLGVFNLVFILIVTSKLLQMKQFNMHVFVQEAIFLPFALFLEQNVKIPVGNSPRIAALSLIWLAFVIGMVYKSNLVGYLTFPEKQEIPRTFKQLEEQKEYNIHMFSLTGGVTEFQIFKSSPSPIFHELVKRVKITNDPEKCVAAATKDKTACICWGNVLHAGIMKQIPTNPGVKSLFVTSRTAYVILVSVAVKKHSIYFEMLNRYAGYATESGLIRKWIAGQQHLERELAFHKARKIKDAENDKGSGLSSQQIQGPLDNDDVALDDKADKALKVENLIAVALAYIFGICVALLCIGVEFGVTYAISIRINHQDTLNKISGVPQKHPVAVDYLGVI